MGVAASARTEPLPRRHDAVFIDEVSERLLLGQVLADAARWRFLHVGADHFNSSRRTLFLILVNLAARAIPFDRDRIKRELAAAGIEPRFADDLAHEWLERCTRISDLERALEARYVRRRVDLAGRVLVEAARDPGGDIEVVRLQARHVRDDLVDVLGRGERR